MSLTPRSGCVTAPPHAHLREAPNPLRGHSPSSRIRFASVLLALLALGLQVLGQGGITEEQGLTVFRTGGTEPLLTLELPMPLPTTNTGPVLRLDFGFATDEPQLPESFFDSFSVTLQGTNLGDTALLLTADRTGVVWAPENPGGLPISEAQVERVATNFPAWLPNLTVRVAYSIAFALPAALTGQPGKLFLDLFDNLNGIDSLAWVGNLRIDGAIPSARLVSSTTVNGAYTEESAAVLDAPNQTFRLPPPAGSRFFRIQAPQPTRITRITVEGGQLAIRFSDLTPRLQSAPAPEGPYADDDAFAWEPGPNRFVGPVPSAPRFFRVSGGQTTVITSIRVEGGQLVLLVADLTVRLLEARTVGGPYDEAFGYRVETELRQIRIPQPDGHRFYRLEANAPLRITRIWTDGEDIVLDF